MLCYTVINDGCHSENQSKLAILQCLPENIHSLTHQTFLFTNAYLAKRRLFLCDIRPQLKTYDNIRSPRLPCLSKDFLYNFRRPGSLQTCTNVWNVISIFQFFSAGLPQKGEDNEGFDGYLLEDIMKEARRAFTIVCFQCF